MKSTTENVKILKGDGLRIHMDINDLKLNVSGDGCLVKVSINNGSIFVVGDGCSLKVNRNEGKIEYKGDGGNIYLGEGSRTDSVSYVGDGGRIIVRKEKGLSSKKEKKEKQEKKSSKIISADEIGPKSRRSVSDSELEVKLENAANERKEANDKLAKGLIDGRRKEKKLLRRSKTVIVTNISTQEIPIGLDGVINNNFVKNWFRNPPSVIKSFKTSSSSESL